ncbi:MAG: CPCC family cysteine-rich protein [Tissierellaceae bacterium]
MGGRGTKSSLVNQINLQDVIDREEIDRIMNHAERVRQGNTTGGGIIGESGFKECMCCENRTIPINSANHRCPVCGWIDDEYQNKNLDSLDGPNVTSLRKARLIWGRKIMS